MTAPAAGVMMRSFSDGFSGISMKYSQNVDARTVDTKAPAGLSPLPRAIW